MADFNATLIGYYPASADIAQPAGFTVTYRLSGGSLHAATETMTVDAFDVEIPGAGEQFIPGSVSFIFGNRNYIDRMGQLFHSIDPANGNGIFGGTFDYSTGKINLQTWHTGDQNTGNVLSALTTSSFNPVDRVVLRTPQAPLKPSSFAIRAALLDGTTVTASSDDSGVFDTAHVNGTIENNTGIAILNFGSLVNAAGQESQPWFDPTKVVNGKIFRPEPVLAETVIYNAVSYTFIPLESNILGLDSARLPMDGKIPVYRKGDVVVIVNDQTTVMTATSNSTHDLGRTRLSRVLIKDVGGNALAANKWSANLDTGIVSFADLAGVSQPITIVDRIQDEAVVSDVQINGVITLSKPVTHNYPATGTLVASALVMGDIFSRATNPFDQQTWTGVWSNVLIGNPTLAQYNYTQYPIEVTNRGAIEERWLIVFQTNNTVHVIGEHVGQVLTGVSILSDIAPINPATGVPYFRLDHLGFGAGWAAGNCLRFNVYQSAKPVYVSQSVLQGEATSDDYRFCLCFSGDVDAP